MTFVFVSCFGVSVKSFDSNVLGYGLCSQEILYLLVKEMHIWSLLIVLIVYFKCIFGEVAGRIVHRKSGSKLPPPFLAPDFEDGKKDYADYLNNDGEQTALDDIARNDPDILTIEDTDEVSVPKFKAMISSKSPKNKNIRYGKTQIIPRSRITRNGQTFLRYHIMIPMEVPVAKDNKQIGMRVSLLT